MLDEALSWMPFAGAMVAFFAAHAIPARPPVRRRLVGMLGERGYLVLYSVLSLLLLFWLFTATAGAPFVEIWPALEWQRHVPQILVPLAFALAVAGLFTANPLSLSARRGAPVGKGTVLAITRHPVLWGLALWAAAHLVPNGDLAHILLFGTLVGLCLMGMVLADRRACRRLGHAQWQALATDRPLVPFSRPGALRAPSGREIRLGLAGLALALGAALLHAFVIGVPAL